MDIDKLTGKILEITNNSCYGWIDLDSSDADRIGVILTEALNISAVSGMFSSDKLEQAYKEGIRDALAKGYGTFDEENYR